MAAAAVLVVAAHLGQPLVLPVRAHLVLLTWRQVVAVPVVPAHLLVQVHLVQVVVVLPVVAGEVALLRLTRSFSAAMAGLSQSPAPPM